MIARLVDRNPPVLVIVTLFGLYVAVLVAWAAFCLARRGAPWHWNRVEAFGFVALVVVGSLGWWWVDGPVEGRSVWTLSDRHGITYADLLAVPALLAAAIVLGTRLFAPPVAPGSPNSAGPARTVSVDVAGQKWRPSWKASP